MKNPARTVAKGLLRRAAAIPPLRQIPQVAWHAPIEVADLGHDGARGQIQLLRPEYRAARPLPVNVPDRNSLPGLVPPWVKSYSFRDVPELTVEASFLIEVSNCWIVRTRYDWGGSEFCICTEEGRPIRHQGLISDDENEAMRKVLWTARKTGNHGRIEQGTWVVGYWYNNYYHWFIEYLPRIALALRQGLKNILLPRLFGDWATDSIELVGLAPLWLPENLDAWKVDRLTIVAESPHHGPAHQLVQEYLNKHERRHVQDIWISRRDASYRRWAQEEEFEHWLAARGWVILQMSKLSLREQIRAISTARTIGGLHGAGLTNMMFAQPGTKVFEVVLRTRPNPDFYSLATTLGHPYWLFGAEPANTDPRPPWDDLILDLEAIKGAIEAL